MGISALVLVFSKILTLGTERKKKKRKDSDPRELKFLFSRRWCHNDEHVYTSVPNIPFWLAVTILWNRVFVYKKGDADVYRKKSAVEI